MATMITEECINCGACEPECPNQAISSVGDLFVIDPVLCTECVGFHDVEQCAAVCPVDCCVEDPNNPEPETLLVARARSIHPDADIGDDFPSRFRTGDASTAAATSAAEAKPAGAAATPAEAPAAEPAKAPAKPAAPGSTIPAALKSFLEKRLESGDPVTIQMKKGDPFTGRVFRLMLEEGWIAVEHDDGRRRAYYVITGGKVSAPDGEEVPLPS